ncbi:MAG: trehalase-like domain-containing protein [Phycisphaerales bacterium]
MQEELLQKLDAVVRSPILLVACDLGRPARSAVEALDRLPWTAGAVIEASGEGEKSAALMRARHAVGATAVLLVGVEAGADELAKSLLSEDVFIRVGSEAAGLRVADEREAVALLERAAAGRAAWVGSRQMDNLNACAVLSDQRTLAVVSEGARVSWLCLPRLDASAVFAELVGGPGTGCFEIVAEGVASRPRAGYDEDTFVFVTEWPGLRVVDYLDASAGRAYQKAGRADLLRVIEGTRPARVRFAPRLDFGRIATEIAVREGGLEVKGSHDPIVLRSPGVRWELVQDGVHHTAEAVVDPGAGPVVLELRYGTANLGPPAEVEQDRREQNRRFWSGWARSLRLPSRRPDLVKRSALVIKALCYGPTGAIAAAATTSLPEQVGGVRNWDYRFCWPRDAAKSAAALVRLGNTGHALRFLDWMLGVLDQIEAPERLRPIYTLSGGMLPAEAELTHLAGYAQSRPVRVGNAAANQVQLDVFGPIVHLVAMLAERGAPIAPDHWRLVRAMVQAVEKRWQEPDHGIWEMRMERRHHVHSKVMCWHTVDRALVVERAVLDTSNPGWLALRDQIREDVLGHGWSGTLGAFGGAYGHDYADAAVLRMGLTGFLAKDDPRWARTVDVVAAQLREGPTVRRYRIDDGLPGGEGGMHICTGWLVESLASLGRLREAEALFDAFAALVNEAGIMTEQHDSRHALPVGNLAQAYSHLALIDAAFALEQASGARA